MMSAKLIPNRNFLDGQFQSFIQYSQGCSPFNLGCIYDSKLAYVRAFFLIKRQFLLCHATFQAKPPHGPLIVRVFCCKQKLQCLLSQIKPFSAMPLNNTYLWLPFYLIYCSQPPFLAQPLQVFSPISLAARSFSAFWAISQPCLWNTNSILFGLP